MHEGWRVEYHVNQHGLQQLETELGCADVACHKLDVTDRSLRAAANSVCLSTASASAIFGAARLAAYSATKHAIKGLTEALAVEDVRCAPFTRQVGVANVRCGRS